jgi:hypothetical protein
MTTVVPQSGLMGDHTGAFQGLNNHPVIGYWTRDTLKGKIAAYFRSKPGGIMIIPYTCRGCGKGATFETESSLQVLVEDMSRGKDRVFVVDCPYCGTQNRVPVEEP